MASRHAHTALLCPAETGMKRISSPLAREPQYSISQHMIDASNTVIDPIALSQALIRCASVTPQDEGALDVLESALKQLGFRTKRYPFEEVDNLYAVIGDSGPNLCFAGHTDVVPVGDAAKWSVDPFAAEIRGGDMIGRGTVDMKCAIAAFVSAVSTYLETNGLSPGRISFLITGDEEGPSINGTVKLLPAITADGETLDACIVGEPTSENTLGDVVKNGRRGSLNGVVRAIGKQGHAAYPEKSANPVPILLDFLSDIKGPMDSGAEGFQPTNLEITSVDVANPAHNVIPAEATAKFNIRFNTNHTGDQLKTWLQEKADRHSSDGVKLMLDLKVTGESFYTKPCRFTDALISAVTAETGAAPALTTGGGTSDARFIKDYCPVAELGLKNDTAHKVDEFTSLAEIEQLTRIYHRLIGAYFS